MFYLDDNIQPNSQQFGGGAPGAPNPWAIDDPDTGVRTVNVTFTVFVENTAPAGIHPNNIIVTSDSPNMICQSGTQGTDGTDIDRDINTGENTCSISTNL